MPLHHVGLREFREVDVLQPERRVFSRARPESVEGRLGHRRTRVAVQHGVGHANRLVFAQQQQQSPSDVVRQQSEYFRGPDHTHVFTRATHNCYLVIKCSDDRYGTVEQAGT